MFKNNNSSISKKDIFIKYFLFYSFFIFVVIFNSTNNNLLRLFPDLRLVLIFFNFIWTKKSFIPLHLLILGFIIDSYSFLPIFLSSFTLLISYKITIKLMDFFVDDKYFIYLLRDFSIFIFSFFLIRWFILSYYNEYFYSFKDILIDITLNLIYFSVFYLFYNKKH